MSDFAQPAAKPGQCPKCSGTGTYNWGAVVNGTPTHSGPCHSCKGTGTQDKRQIATNHAYNRHKLSDLAAGMHHEPDHDDA